MKKIILTVAILLFHSMAQAQYHGQKIIGYIPDYGDASHVQYEHLTHAIFCFLFVRPDGSLDHSLNQASLQQYLDATESAATQRLISLSGHYGHLGAVSRDAGKRQALCDTLVEFCQHYGFEGLDLDWEGLQNQQDSLDFHALVMDLSFRLKQEHLQFVITVGFGDYSGKWFSTEALQQADWLQVMVYDAAGTWSDSPMDNHASMQHFMDADRYWTQRGFSRNQLVMGLPFYGRKFSSVSGGFTQPVAYKEITALYPDLADDQNKTPDNDLTCFNGPALVRRKCKYTIDSSFAGVFMWEMTQDVQGEKSLHRQVLNAYDQGSESTFSCSPTDLQQALIAHWSFDGHAEDESVNGHHGTITSAMAVANRFDASGKALHFSQGSRVDMQAAPVFDVDDFSVSAWIKPDPTTYSGIQPILAKFDTYPGPFSFYLEEGKLKVYLMSVDYKYVVINSVASLSSGQWHHVALTHSYLQGTRLYIDGVWQNEDLQMLHTYQAPLQPMRIGASLNFDYQFYGTMDDISLYGIALNSCAIDSLFQASREVVTSTSGISRALESTVYPNPNKGTFVVQCPFSSSKVRVVLSNTMGEVIQTYETTAGELVISEPLVPGVYQVSCTESGNHTVHHVIVQ